MNYLLHYSGKFPEYGKTCIDTIKYIDPQCEVTFCGTEKLKEVNSVMLEDLENDLIREVKSLDYYKEKNNSLWQDSLLRIFYILNLAKLLKLESFVHFDLDVLIYTPFSEIQDQFIKNKINITPGNESNLIFGYSYMHDLSILEEVCLEVLKILKNSSFYENKFYNKQTLNEMEILAIVYHKRPELFNLLETSINNSNYVFDANSYGQYIGGLPDKSFSKRYLNSAHYSGRAMIELGFRPELKNFNPQIIFKGQKNRIVNLHIHSKKLSKYSPKNAK